MRVWLHDENEYFYVITLTQSNKTKEFIWKYYAETWTKSTTLRGMIGRWGTPE